MHVKVRQERFHSFVIDEPHLLSAARYVELNPVRAGRCQTAEQWPWSSARAHLRAEDDELVRVRPLLDLVPDWSSHLASHETGGIVDQLYRHVRTGRPLGSEDFIKRIEARLGRVLRPQKPEPKARSRDAHTPDMLSGLGE